MEKKINIFDYLNSIFYKNDIEYDKKIAPAYMLNMWLSHDNKLLNTCNDINEYMFLLPDNLIYEYFYNSVPSGKRWIRWVKKENIKLETEELREQFNISKKEAQLYEN